jgi:broad specificity phosphatase PhoE
MGNIYLVRHGQASFGALDYDNLSELGTRQSVRLGQYLGQSGVPFEAVLTGTLQRHTQTFAGICDGMGGGVGEPPPAALQWPGLNEFDGEAIITALHPPALQDPTTPEGYKQHFRLLRDGLRQWMAGVISPVGMPSYTDFVHGVTSALAHVRKSHTGNVLIVSSGGPISTAVGHILGTAPETTIDLNMRIRNSAITELVYNPKRCTLQTFNTLPHLDGAHYAPWVTYS